ncbi:MAG TPA: transglutaminase family protein [Burkholderiaceae bacterium]|nr:transglutaminase family protein [Burkholderiaceae bacterium]
MSAARYRVEHATVYDYAEPVLQSWQLAHLTPRALPWQRPLAHELAIEPVPHERRDMVDAYGNTAVHFALHGPHRSLRVVTHSLVEVDARPGLWTPGMPWEAVRDATRGAPPVPDLMAAHFCEPSPMIPLSWVARDYAAPLFWPGRDWYDAVTALMRAIHRDFVFDAQATAVGTSVDEVLARRRGVCQDFAHLMLAALRAHGLPARYVSGYLLTDPPPGQPRLQGVDASHAWVAAHAPGQGWVEFDPTNDQHPDARYITLAWGADFGDVAPLRGVIVGGGQQRLSVAVSVLPA